MGSDDQILPTSIGENLASLVDRIVGRSDAIAGT